MKISIQKNPKGKSISRVFLLAQNEELKDHLSSIAEESGIDAKSLTQDFEGKPGQFLSFYSGQNGRYFLMGIGKEISYSSIQKNARLLSHRQGKSWKKKILLDLQSLETEHFPETSAIEAAVNGLALGRYQTGHYQTDRKEEHALAKGGSELIIRSAKRNARKAADVGLTTADTQSKIMDLVNAPGNIATPPALGRWAKKSGKHFGYKVKVLGKKECEQTGLHALLAVNRGSEYAPAFIICEYKGKAGRKKLPKIGLVGKGVTFDTGGLSIKGSNNMHYMKSDMAGGAAVLGAVELAARLELPVHLIGIVPATDNCVDAKAIKPGDIIRSYSKKTIEVIDTDAEGRLILADGLHYMAKKFKPDYMVDLATLTGSCVRTLGYEAAGLFTTNDDLSNLISEAGDETGERVWRLPMWAAYEQDLKSDVADVKNFSGKPVAGAITAAKFLEVFTNEHPAWAHLDIAGAAFGGSEFSIQKSATAYGVRLLIRFVRLVLQDA